MGVTEEGISMSDESKNKAGLPDKGDGPFLFWAQSNCANLSFDKDIIQQILRRLGF